MSGSLEEAVNRLDLNGGNQVTEGDHDSGVDESTQKSSPRKANGATPAEKNRSRGPRQARPMVQRSQSVPKPFSTFGNTPNSGEVKKVPMNKVKVGMSHSPNLKQVRSKIGSLNNATHRPGGGEFKIESRKLEWKAEARTQAKNEQYTPKGGQKKIESRRLTWNAQSKIGSLDNTKHKPGGGEKKISNQKLEWKADSKVGSTDYLKHKPGGGQVKVFNQKVEVAGARSKIGSLDNVKHRPSGGDKKIFNDVEYLKQMSETTTTPNSGKSSRRQSAAQTPEPPALSTPQSQMDIDV